MRNQTQEPSPCFSLIFIVSILLEANALLENFQWENSEDAVDDSIQNIKEEMVSYKAEVYKKIY